MREVLFQGDGFDGDLRDLPLAMKSALALAKRYASSGDVSAEAVREVRHGIRAIGAKQQGMRNVLAAPRTSDDIGCLTYPQTQHPCFNTHDSDTLALQSVRCLLVHSRRRMMRCPGTRECAEHGPDSDQAQCCRI
jgi:hypothetical protein